MFIFHIVDIDIMNQRLPTMDKPIAAQFPQQIVTFSDSCWSARISALLTSNYCVSFNIPRSNRFTYTCVLRHCVTSQDGAIFRRRC